MSSTRSVINAHTMINKFEVPDMIINELINEDIQIGDSIDLEFGDLLIETIIEDITSDGVVVALDSKAIELILEAKKTLNESKLQELEEGWKSKVAAAGLAGLAALGAGGAHAGGVTLGGGGHTMQDQIRMNQQMSQQVQKQQAPKRDLSSFTSSYLEQAASGQGGRFLVSPEEAKSELAARDAGTSSYKAPQKSSSQSGSGFSKDYLEQVVSGKVPRPLISVEKAQSLLGQMNEAEYQGRKVPLGKPMKGDVKKSKVYVKGPKGNVVKVNFGDKNMKIKKSNPKRRKSFRARHNCANPGPRWKARYWSCRAW